MVLGPSLSGHKVASRQSRNSFAPKLSITQSLDLPQEGKSFARVLDAFYSDTWFLGSAIGPQSGVKAVKELVCALPITQSLDLPQEGKSFARVWSFGDDVGLTKWRQQPRSRQNFKKRVFSSRNKRRTRLRGLWTPIIVSSLPRGPWVTTSDPPISTKEKLAPKLGKHV